MIKYLLSLVFNIVVLSSAFGQTKELQCALDYINQGYIVYGIQALKDCANHSNTWAQFFIGQCYEYGYSGEKNPTEAFLYYRKTAEKGLAIAQYSVAKCYDNGFGTSVNLEKARMWLKKSEGRFNFNDLTFFQSLYNNGLNHPEHYNENPTGYANTIGTNNTTIQNNGNIHSNNTIGSNNQTINNITIVQSTSNQPVVQSQNSQQSVTAKSDVDKNIPVNPQTNENTFALIIANEKYQDVASVPNAQNDGKVFAEYCKKTLGLPETNVHLVLDATLNNIKREINLIKQITEAYKGQAKLIVYYAGHGMPDESTRVAYILPVDGFGSDLTTCYSLSSLYDTFGHMSTSQVVVLLDACFSGSLRGDGMLASARGVAIKAKTSTPTSKMVVLSAAQGDETAYAYKQQNHGLFTYFLLKKLKETKGDMTIGELANYIKDNVTKKSLLENKKSQTPTVTSGMKITEWENLKLK